MKLFESNIFRYAFASNDEATVPVSLCMRQRCQSALKALHGIGFAPMKPSCN